MRKAPLPFDRFFAPVLLKLACLFALAGTAGCTVVAAAIMPRESWPVITSVSAIRKLTKDQAERHFPVHLRGIVTYFSPAEPTLFIQDTSGGIWIRWTRNLPEPSIGDILDLAGLTEQPGFAPQISSPKWTVVGRGPLPIPHSTNFNKLVSAVEDSQRVRIDGFVRQIVRRRRKGGSPILWLDLAVGTRRIHAQVPWSEAPVPISLLDAHVSVSGVCQSEFNGNFQLTGISILAPNISEVIVLEPPRRDPFLLTPAAIGELQRYGGLHPLESRLKLAGVVTAAVPDRGVYIRDNTGAVYVETRQDDLPKVGDEVEALGFVDISQQHIRIQDAELRRTGASARPVPLKADGDDVMGGRYESELVQLQGKVIEHSLFRSTQAFVVQRKKTVFSVSAPPHADLGILPNPGSTVRITGICVTEVDVVTGRVIGFRLISRSPADIVVLQNGPWWTRTRVLVLMTSLGTGALMALLWVVVLRRRVASQTELIRATVESTADGILVVDRRQKAVLWNKKFTELWRIPGHVLRTRDDREFLKCALGQLADPKGFLARVEALYQQPDVKCEDRLEFIDGRVIERHSEPQIVGGRNVGLVWGFRDITDRVRAEDARSRRIRQQAAVAELGQFALTETKFDAVLEKACWLTREILQVSECKISKYDAAGSQESIAPNSETNSSSQSTLVEIAGPGQAWGSLWVPHPNGCALTREDEYFLNQIANVLASAAARKQIDLELEASRDAAQAGSKAKSEFLAMMSHEIRTPMNGVIGMTGLLRETALTQEQKEYVAIIQHSGEVLLALISDILDFSKIEAGKLELESTAFPLKGRINDAMDIIGQLARQKNLDVSLEWDERLPSEVVGDPVRVRQILLNLLFNAVKFTMQGSIRVRVRREQVNGSDDLHICFEVADTGIGIAPEALNKLFDSFSQADRSTTRKYGGTGLGLAISKRLVELMGGQIGGRSELGQGSCFWFVLSLPAAPIVQPASPAECPALSEQKNEKSEQGFSILVAEDNAVNRKVLVHMLTRHRHLVDVAGDGLEAVSMANAKKYDLILMDCQMPRMDGLQASRVIRSEGGLNGSTPIVAVTANAFSDDRLQCLAAGMNDHVSKPISRLQLDVTIERWAGSENVVHA